MSTEEKGAIGPDALTGAYVAIDYKALGSKFKHVRGTATQADFAKQFGITRAEVSKIERGEGRPTAELLYNICLKYHLSIEWMLSGHEPSLDSTQEELFKEEPVKQKVLKVVPVQEGPRPACATEDGRKIGRIRMQRIPAASGLSLHRFIVDSIEPGSIVHTDGWQGYRGLEAKGYRHDVTILKGRKETALELLPRVHWVVSSLKRWLFGTHQGAVSPEHLDYYLYEFTFRFNRRTSRSRGKLFWRLLQQAVAAEPTPYRSMVRHVRGRKPDRHNR